jgi:hypothetical protein
MSKYNKEGEEDYMGVDSSLPKWKRYPMIAYKWVRANPLKVVIIIMSIINFALLVSIPDIDHFISIGPDLVDDL